MAKKYLIVAQKERTYKLFCEDLTKIIYLNRKKMPKIPKYENLETTDDEIDSRMEK
jgi:hypothetical protein